MIRPRPRARSSDGPPRHSRWAPLLGLTTASSLCVFAACALLVPGFVFGAEPPSAEEAGPALAAAEATGSPATTEDSLLVTLPWGSGAGEVGLAEPGEGLTRGPEALAIAPDGRIAVLDSVNGRVVLLDALGKVVGTIPVPLAEPRFLAVNDDLLYVLDCDADRRLLTLDWSGTIRGLTAMPSMRDVVTGLFATSQGPCVEVAHAFVYLIRGRATAAGGLAGVGELGSIEPQTASLEGIAGRPVDASMGLQTQMTFAPGAQPRVTCFVVGASGTLSTSTSELDLAVPSGRRVDHLLSIDGDVNGGLIVGARLLDTSLEGEPACLVLRRFITSENGAISLDPSGGGTNGTGDTLVLLDSSLAYVGQPYTVASDGRVLQPVATESGYSIYVHHFAGAPVFAQAMEVSR